MPPGIGYGKRAVKKRTASTLPKAIGKSMGRPPLGGEASTLSDQDVKRMKQVQKRKGK
jgi:hypothetical protein